MRLINRFWAIFVIAFKRILSQPGMAVATVLGMIFAISLSMSVPLYASSVYNRIFLQEVSGVNIGSQTGSHPPFSFLYTYDSNILGNLQWQDLRQVTDLLLTQSERLLGLPVKQTVRYFATNPLSLFPASVTEFPDNEKPLMWSSIGFMSELDQHVTIIEGSYPKISDGGPVEVMVMDVLANEQGMQVGEEYTLFARNQIIDGARTTVLVPVRIVGVYQVRDAQEEYWFIRSTMLEDRMITSEEAFSQQLSPMINDEIYVAFWYVLADGSSIRPEQAATFSGRIQAYQRQAEQALPKIRLAASPVKALADYQKAANLLTLLLFAFSVPIFGLLLAFITMTAGMTVERQRNEIAMLRSRGAMIAQMLGIATVESLLLGALALAISLPVSAGITRIIGQTRSFLDFSANSTVAIHFSSIAIYFGIGAIVLTILARLLPTVRAARDNIVLYKRERARSLRPPLWQRMWLDVLLMIPAGYGIYQLRQQGSIATVDASNAGNPYSNPLLIMVPALAIFALSLFFLRLLPGIMTAITWIASRTKSVGIMMAARHLARSPGSYTLPLVLLILTLSLSAFTATLAGTLDNHLYEQVYYKTGADVSFLDLGDSPEPDFSPGGSTSTGQSSSQAGWLFLPVTEYLRLPGVENATRVGRFNATAILGNRYTVGDVMGVDRASLPGIAFWRGDFANPSLGELMNRLAAQPDGIIVPDDFLQQNAINPGDLLTVRVSTGQKATEMDFYVVGGYDLFPTYYPGEKPMFIANLDFIFQEAGGEYPYSVWLNTNGETDIETLQRAAITQIGARATSWEDSAAEIAEEQTQPERQGLFGVLSVGFAAAAVLTVLGFLMYALLSYQRRFVELGVLRAVGLSAWQMTMFLAAELAFLILVGGLVGTGLGVWISNMFIQYLQVGSDAASQIPPYVVYVAWPAIMRVYALFGLLFVVALATLVVLLRRMKIFQAIKMGEAL